jgi:hypothetical protein
MFEQKHPSTANTTGSDSETRNAEFAAEGEARGPVALAAPPKRRLRRVALRAALLAVTATTAAACTQQVVEESEKVGTTESKLEMTIPQFAAFFAQKQAEIVASRFENLYTGFWTNWYHKPKAEGLVQLAIMRDLISRQNLFHAYPTRDADGNPVRTAGYPAEFVCAPETATNRTIDGTCNDPNDPGMGAAGTRFGRNVPLAKAFPNEAELLTPNPREVSRELLTRKQFVPVPFLNMIAVSWIQFMVHDWFNHTNSTTGMIQVPLAQNDPLRRRDCTDSLFIPKTAPDPTRTALDGFFNIPPTYLNETTHWWDGSQVYGSDLQTANRLRTFRGGKLKISARGRLPIGEKGIEDVGFNQNWWLGLSMMHHLFVLEHNKIADMLAATYPQMSDQQIYDKARLINAAVMAKIHTVEWTPAILPNETLTDGMYANWYGLYSDRQKVNLSPLKRDRSPQNPLAPLSPALYGIVANVRDLAGVPFSLTEEFVSVYRMHSLLPDTIRILNPKNGRLSREIRLEDTRNNKSHVITNQIPMPELFNSFGKQHPGALVLNNYPAFLQDLKVPGLGAFDLGTVDILRDRERGVPRYNEFRRLLRLKPLSSIDDITDVPEHRAALKRIYGDDPGAIERVDLMIGCQAEAHRPTNFGFGETTFQVFILIASRRLHGDRFFTDLYTPEVYTQAGIDWVDGASMKTVLLRNYPELASTELTAVDNAFAPWAAN